MSGWLFGTRVIDLPESKEGVQFFAYRELPRWSQVQIPLNSYPELMEVIDALEAHGERAAPQGTFQTCAEWAERGG